MTEVRDPLILAIGGGKGGVGKSMVSANLAVHYAQAGLDVALLDLDFGAANLHTLFGMRKPPRGLGDYFKTPRSQLVEFLTPTAVDGLMLGAGSGFVPELANLRHMQKTKLMRQIRGLQSDLVLLDLGAGSANNVVDFFSLTRAGIIVSTPEPTAVVNAYEFLKNVIYRILFRMFKNQPDILELIQASTIPGNPQGIETVAQLTDAIALKNKWVAETIREVCADLDFYVIFNQARKAEQAKLGQRLQDICHKHLNINLNYAGMIFFNEEVSTSVFKMCPISLQNPGSVTSKTLKRIAGNIFDKVTCKMMGEEDTESFDAQVDRVSHFAEQDYAKNMLTQLRLLRQREMVDAG